MTLILSIITPEYVLQVGDRRLTHLKNKTTIIDTDKTTKTVLFDCKFSFSYTGLAQLPRAKKVQSFRKEKPELIDTNLWIAECLSIGTSMNNCLDIIKEEADEIFSKKPYSEYPHAFIGVGWIQYSGKPIEPAVFEISRLQNEAKFSLVVKHLNLSSKKFPYLFHYSFYSLPKYIVDKYANLMKNASKKINTAPIFSNILRNMIREVSGFNTSVGDGILQTCIPYTQVKKSLDKSEYILKAGRPSNEYVSFSHFTSSNEKDDNNQHGPTIVHGQSIFKELTLDKDKIVTMKFEQNNKE